MKTIQITIEYNLLDVEDIEEAISSYLGKKTSISDVECTLVYSIPADTQEPDGMFLEFVVDDNEFYSFDIFYDEEIGHCYKGKQLALDERWLPLEDIFNFDVSLFKNFDSYTDSSD